MGVDIKVISRWQLRFLASGMVAVLTILFSTCGSMEIAPTHQEAVKTAS